MIKLMLFLFSFSAGAATTGTLQLQGLIPEFIELVITATGSNTGLDLTTSQVDLHVADVTESSNSATGYTISIASQNQGLKHTVSNTTIPYTATYNGVGFALNTAGVQVKSNNTGGVVSETSALAISYTGVSAAAYESGSYTDTLTISIQAL